MTLIAFIFTSVKYHLKNRKLLRAKFFAPYDFLEMNSITTYSMITLGSGNIQTVSSAASRYLHERASGS